MASGKLTVSYRALDSKINDIQKICSNGHYTLQSINSCKGHFSVSNSDTAKELIKALEEYKKAHNIIMDICSKSISMLDKAKFVYDNSDFTSSGCLNGEEK